MDRQVCRWICQQIDKLIDIGQWIYRRRDRQVGRSMGQLINRLIMIMIFIQHSYSNHVNRFEGYYVDSPGYICYPWSQMGTLVTHGFEPHVPSEQSCCCEFSGSFIIGSLDFEVLFLTVTVFCLFSSGVGTILCGNGNYLMPGGSVPHLRMILRYFLFLILFVCLLLMRSRFLIFDMHQRLRLYILCLGLRLYSSWDSSVDNIPQSLFSLLANICDFGEFN